MAERIEGLNYKLSVDSTQFTGGLNQSSRQLEKFASDSAAQSQKIQSSLSNVGQTAQGFFATLKSEGPVQALSAMQNSILGVSSSLTAAVGPVALFAAGISAAFALIISQAEKAAENIRSISKTAKALGQDSTDTQILLKVFERGGFDQAGAQASLLRFQSHLGEIGDNPDSAIADRFRRIGLDPQAVANAPLTTAFAETIEALRGISNVTDRARAAQEIFGRSAIELAPVIARGGRAFGEAATEVERYGLSIEQVNTRRSQDAFNRQFQLTNPSFIQGIQRGWRDWVLGFSNILEDLDYSYTVLTGQFVNGPGVLASTPTGASTLAFDAVADAARRAASVRREVTANAIEQLEAVRRQIANLGKTAAEIRALELRRTGVAEGIVTESFVADTILERAQKELELRKQIVASFVNQKSAMLAIVGINEGSIEDAKITADLQTRGRNGADAAAQNQAGLLEAIEAAIQEQNRRTDLTNEILSRLGPVQPAAGF